MKENVDAEILGLSSPDGIPVLTPLQERNRLLQVLVIADLHCSSRVGLTPPLWQWKEGGSEERIKFSRIQREIWNWYTTKLSLLPPTDLLIVNGDLLEGPGTKSGGTELITRDRNEQVDMAVQCIQAVKAKQIYITRGSNSHAGSEEDWEDLVAKQLGCRISNQWWFDANGLILDVKHCTTGGGTPQTKNNGILTDALWNLIWSEKACGQPKANVFVRSHLHFSTDAVGITPNSRVFITPALQAAGTKFGERYCRRVVDVGMLSFEIQDERNWTWTTHIAELQSAAGLLVRL